jgi:hypothetical protein
VAEHHEEEPAPAPKRRLVGAGGRHRA